MPLSKEKKKELLERLKAVSKAKSVAFVNFHGLSVADANELRRALRASGVSYLVSKKTLAKKALGEAGFAGTVPELAGELGIAWSDDQLAPTREAFSFQKKFEGRVSLLGGVFEGKFIGREEAKALALIPPRQTLLAQFANLINSPIQGLVMVLDGIAKKKV
ncbi:50S ribosomal protein L10 [Patescibacteria group bacterium]|nr:50S ribosomal protein L10 [Patescibacteria group bacterium]